MHTMMGLHSVQHTSQQVRLRWADGAEATFAAIWLRDNIPAARHRADGQKLFDITELPAQVHIRDAALSAQGGLRVSFEPEHLDAEFDAHWLARYARPEAGGGEPRVACGDEPRVGWDASLPALPRADFAHIRDDPRQLAAWLRAVLSHGFALLHGVPAQPGRVLDVVALFGYVRETNYGRVFDVITEPAPANLANAGIALGLHTDNPYREPVPTLQLLHCLAASAHGGDSVLCDGIRVAEALRAAHPEDFALLTRHAVRFRYVDEHVDLDCRAPMIETDAAGAVRAVRYNNRSLAPLELDAQLLPDYYRAYRRFSTMLHDASATVSFRLAPGDLFIVDNRRVLHGRGAFGAGRRHLQGCYADIDSLRSTLRQLERSLGDAPGA